MKREELFDLLESIDGRHIEAAQALPRRRWRAPLALCACLGLLLGAGLWLGRPAPISPLPSEPSTPAPDLSRVRAADLLASDAELGLTGQAARSVLLPVAGRAAEYCQSSVSSRGEALLPESLGAPLEKAAGWYLLRGHDELQYLIHTEEDGSYTLWEFSCFTVLDEALASDDSPFADQPWFSADTDFSPYSYALVLQTIYGVASPDDLRSITVSPANMDNTDEGKAIQAEIGTLTVTDAESLAAVYDALSSMTCLGGGHWELIGVSGELPDAVRKTRYLTISAGEDITVTSLKYTARSDRFYEYGGIAYSPLGQDEAARLCRIFGIG